MRSTSGLSRSHLREYGQPYFKSSTYRMSAKSLSRALRKRKVAERGQSTTKTIAQLGVLTAMALTIFVVEMQIPPLVPIPGIKLGLANIITMYAIYYYRPREVMGIVFTRIFLGAIFGGNLSALMYSFAGSTLCLLGMLPLHKVLPKKFIWLNSMIGAVLHNVGQFCVALLVMGEAIIAYLPFLMVSGFITGIFTGLCAQILVFKLNKNKIEKELRR